jgi:hypothetical protein
MIKDAIRKGHSYVALVKALDGVCPPNNIFRKQCCRHFVPLQCGSLGQGVRKKVQDCVAGDYMGHLDSYAAETAPGHSHTAETALRDSYAAETALESDTTSETQLEEE